MRRLIFLLIEPFVVFIKVYLMSYLSVELLVTFVAENKSTILFPFLPFLISPWDCLALILELAHAHTESKSNI